MQTIDTPLMDLLRDETAELHKAAEGHEMQRALVQGALPRERYADYLEQLWVVHAALERSLEAHADKDARLAGLSEAAGMHRHHLVEDLDAMSRSTEGIAPTRGARALAERIEADGDADPIRLLGHFYVLEGSMNGNRFIAKAVERLYELKPDAGLRYFNSYGEDQRPNWYAFKERMNAHAYSAEEREVLVERAQGVFRAIAEIGDELEARL